MYRFLAVFSLLNVIFYTAVPKAAATPGPSVKLVAHRGYSKVAPENTMAAFRAAWNDGASYAIETDVYMTADGEAVCIHDDNLHRTGKGSKEKKIHKMTAKEIRRYDVGSWKSPRYAGEKVPLMRELFAALPPNGKIFLEIKYGGKNFPAKLKHDMAKAHLKPEQIIVISFSQDELRRIKQECPELKTYLLFWIGKKKNSSEIRVTAPELIKILKNLGCDGVDTGGFDLVDAAYVQQVKKAGYDFGAWTIDNPAFAAKLRDWGVDIITTNTPVELQKALK